MREGLAAAKSKSALSCGARGGVWLEFKADPLHPGGVLERSLSFPGHGGLGCAACWGGGLLDAPSGCTCDVLPGAGVPRAQELTRSVSTAHGPCLSRPRESEQSLPGFGRRRWCCAGTGTGVGK